MFGRRGTLQRIILLIALYLVVFPPGPLFSQEAREQEAEEKTDELFKMSLEELMNVKITTAGKTEETVREIPASVVVITREEIERYGYRSVAEILENVPGLYAIDNRAVHGRVFGVRGYWTQFPSNFIVLVNDTPQGNGWSYYELQNFNLPVEAIDRIEVVRGPMSIMYGSGAFFGAINIFTNEPSEGEATSLISASYGSEKTKNAAFRYAYNEDDLKFVFNAGFYDTYGPNEPLSKMTSDMQFISEYYGISEANNNTTTDGRLEDNNVYFNFSGKYKGFFADVSLNRSAREEYHFWPSFSDGLLHKTRFTTISFGYNHEVSQELALKGTLKYYMFSYWREFDYFETDFFGQEQNQSTKFEVELHAEFKPSDHFKVLTGVNFNTKDTVDKLDLRHVYLTSTGHYQDNIRYLAMFTQANYSPSNKLKFVGGIRLEKLLKYPIEYQNNESSAPVLRTHGGIEKIELVPRFAVIYTFNDSNILKFLYGKAVKFPTYIDVVQQIFSQYDDLESEYISTFELNYLASLSSNFSLNISVFHNNLNNLIVNILKFDDDGNWAPQRSNSGKLISNGIELMIYAKPFENFLMELSGTYQKSKDKRPGFEGRDVQYSPNFLGYLKASYSFTPDISLALTGKYVGGMETLWDITKDNPDGLTGGGERIANKVDAYFILDGNFRINNIFGKGYYLNFRCSNLFDTDYLYPLSTNNSGWADKGTFGSRRTFILSIGKKF